MSIEIKEYVGHKPTEIKEQSEKQIKKQDKNTKDKPVTKAKEK